MKRTNTSVRLLVGAITATLLLGCGSEAASGNNTGNKPANTNSATTNSTPANNTTTDSNTNKEDNVSKSEETEKDSNNILKENYGFKLYDGDGSNNVNQNHEAIGVWSTQNYVCMIATEDKLYAIGNHINNNWPGLCEMSKDATIADVDARVICEYSDEEYEKGATAMGFLDEDNLVVIMEEDYEHVDKTVWQEDGSGIITSMDEKTLAFYKIPIDSEYAWLNSNEPYNKIKVRDVRANASYHELTPKLVGEWLHYECFKDLESLEKNSSKTKEEIQDEHLVQFCRTSVVTGKTEVLFEYSLTDSTLLDVVFEESGNFVYTYEQGENYPYTYTTYYYDAAVGQTTLLKDTADVTRLMGMNEGYVYLRIDGDLYRILCDTKEQELVFSHGNIRFSEGCNINFSKEYIFFSFEGDELYVIPKDNIGGTSYEAYPEVRLMMMSSANASHQAVSSGMWIWDDVLWISHGVDYMHLTGVEISTVLDGEASMYNF